MDLTSKVLKLFHLNEGTEFAPAQLKTLPKPLISTLSRLDGQESNGFTRQELEKYLGKEGLKGIARFYPHYDFQETSECIHPKFKKDVFAGRLNATDPNVRPLLHDLGLPPDAADKTLIRYASYKKGAPIVVVVADLHHNVRYNHLAHQLVRFIRAEKPMPLFYEQHAGKSVYLEQDAQNFWAHEQVNLSQPALMDLTQQELNLIENPKERMALAVASNLARYLKGKLGLKDIPTLKELRDLAQKDLVIQALLGQRDPRFLWALIRPENVQFNLETIDPKTLALWKPGNSNPQARVMKKTAYEALDKMELLAYQKTQAQKCDYAVMMQEEYVSAYNQASRAVNEDCDKRTHSWSANIKEVIQSRKAPVVFVQGGALHIPLLTADLKDYSVIVFEPL